MYLTLFAPTGVPYDDKTLHDKSLSSFFLSFFFIEMCLCNLSLSTLRGTCSKRSAHSSSMYNIMIIISKFISLQVHGVS